MIVGRKSRMAEHQNINSSTRTNTLKIQLHVELFSQKILQKKKLKRPQDYDRTRKTLQNQTGQK